MQEITVPSTTDQVDLITEFVHQQMAGYRCPAQTSVQINVAIDEIFSNIARYGYPQEPGPVTIGAEVEKDPPALLLTFIDRGLPYNPLTHEEPATIGLSAKQRVIGGLGLFIVRKTMDDIRYSYENGQNILTVRKKI